VSATLIVDTVHGSPDIWRVWSVTGAWCSDDFASQAEAEAERARMINRVVTIAIRPAADGWTVTDDGNEFVTWHSTTIEDARQTARLRERVLANNETFPVAAVVVEWSAGLA
jgi:hypothetical protein